MARRPVPRPPADRQPAGADRHQERRRGHHQPVDLPGRAVEGHVLRRTGQRARRARRRRRRHHPHRDHRRRAQCLRRAGQAVRARPTASTAGCRSRWTRGWPTTPTRRSCRRIELWKIVDRPNLLIKIPATLAGLPAITAVIAEGISVNVTLIFSVERHQAVIDAYLAGLEAAKEAGHDLSKIHSVASFFVSRVDTEIDKRLEKIGTDEALALRGRPGSPTPGWPTRPTRRCSSAATATSALKADGARVQRPLWASTGVKNPDYSDTLYVTELVAPNTVNTMPEKTIDAVADHGVITGDTVSGHRRRSPGGLRRTDGRRHRPDRCVQGARGRGRGEVREVLARTARGDPGLSWTPPRNDRRAIRPAGGLSVSYAEAHRRLDAIRCGTSATSGCRASPGRAGW